MGEVEALIRRRDMLMESISKMDYEIEKIDRRLAFLGWTAEPGNIELSEGSEMYVQGVA